MKMLDSAIKLISTKAYTRYELASVLESQFAELPNLDVAIKKVIGYLSLNGLIQDRRIAQDLCERYQHKGNQFLRNLLTLRKINTKEIEEVLEAIADEKTRAWDFITSYFAHQTLPLMKLDKNHNHLARLLSGRQFHPSTINFIIEKIEKLDCAPIRASNIEGENKKCYFS